MAQRLDGDSRIFQVRKERMNFIEVQCPACRRKRAVFPDDPDRMNCMCGAVLVVDRGSPLSRLLASLPIRENLFDFGAWDAHERRPCHVLTAVQIEGSITRLIAERTLYKKKQRLDLRNDSQREKDNHVVWYDGISFLYKVWRVDHDGFVIIRTNVGDDGHEIDYGRD